MPSLGSCCKLEMEMVIAEGPLGPPVLSRLLFSGRNLWRR